MTPEFYPSCAESKIPAVKIARKYSDCFYTMVPAGKSIPDRFFSSPVVNWMEKSKVPVNQL